MRTQTLVLVPLLASLASCVPTGKYDAAVADAAQAHTDMSRAQAEAARIHAADLADAEKLRAEIATADARASASLQTLETERQRSKNCGEALDAATALDAGLRKELGRLGKDVDQLLAAKGTLSSSLQQARARLDELRRAQVAADARAALFRDVALKLKRMLDAGDLQISLRSGRMVLVLPNDVLFDSGKADVKLRGRETLAQIATVLASFDSRRFQVAGHTDDEPIHISKFTSNWELSTARGLAVVAFLVKSGMHPETLSAAGYAEFDPVQANDSPEHRAKNRRTEITLQPNIDDLVSVPEAVADAR